MSDATEAVMLDLVGLFPGFGPVLAEHLEDNFDEMLPHLAMSDFVRWLVEQYYLNPAVCESAWAWLEESFDEGPQDVRNLIAVSAVEMIPDPGDPGSGMRDMLGPSLREMDDWLQ
ncbi:DUF7674 family protein [Arthrobacter cupressi]|uniref:DUF7674 family protein n=1 Tax=Arthrobacter cupressi TaxID=1045773 RepID=UPI0011141CF6|nr:hypothetical protein [Arthrobacter cupressi]NYD77854.1 hypothetical protein [Arthrobacter cupressi]